MDKKVRDTHKSKVKSDKHVKKTIIRNSQAPIRESAINTVNLQLNIADNGADLVNVGSESRLKDKLKVQISDIGGCASQIKISKNSKDKIGSADKNQEDEIKRVNIPFGEKKYKGLVDLGSLEAVLAETQAESSTTVNRNRRTCLPNKDPEPVLSDYYKPNFNTEYVFKFPTVPTPVEKEWFYNPRSVVDVLDRIKSDDSHS